MVAVAFCLRYRVDMAITDTSLETLFAENSVDQLLATLGALGSLEALGRSVEAALAGDPRAVHSYLARYRKLTRSLLEAAAQAVPEMVSDQVGTIELQDQSGEQGGFIVAALDESAANAPFSRWAAALGFGEGVAMHALASLRELLPDTAPLTPPDAAPVLAISELAARRFLRSLRLCLNGDEPPLEHVQHVFGLNYTELGGLFGVTRQAAKDWLERGVPADRQDKVATVAGTADLLERKLKPDRIPGIARRPADAYHGKTMLALIAEDRHHELLEITRASFNWTTAA